MKIPIIPKYLILFHSFLCAASLIDISPSQSHLEVAEGLGDFLCLWVGHVYLGLLTVDRKDHKHDKNNGK